MLLAILVSTDLNLVFINTLETGSQQQYKSGRNEDVSLARTPSIVTLNDIFRPGYFLVLAFYSLKQHQCLRKG